MARSVAAAFPDRQIAGQAAEKLKAAGFTLAAEDERAPADNGAPPDCIVVAESHGGEEPDLRALLMDLGAVRLQGRGVDIPEYAGEYGEAVEAPIPVEHGERAPGGADAEMRGTAN